MDVCLLWVSCVVRWRSLRRIDHSSRGVLPTVARRCVWSRNLENEEAKARYWAVKNTTTMGCNTRKTNKQQGGEIGINMGDHKYQDSSTSELCCIRKLVYSVMYLPRNDTRSTLIFWQHQTLSGYKVSGHNLNVERVCLCSFLTLMICITQTCVLLHLEPSWQAYLQGTSIAEGEGPGFLASVLVDSIKVDRSFFFRLSTRQKRNAWNMDIT